MTQHTLQQVVLSLFLMKNVKNPTKIRGHRCSGAASSQGLMGTDDGLVADLEYLVRLMSLDLPRCGLFFFMFVI